MPEIPYRGVTSNDVTVEELWAHGLSIEHADDVWEGPAKHFNQAAREQVDDAGILRRQPARVVMIGPDRTGRMLTFILEAPGGDSVAQVVTGWPSDNEERVRYQRPGGRMRQR